ncbi:MAG TPA: hypothetical protein VI731_10725 [Bacteroidia bacterium]|nr:hypothetical protein [Bacteroidia bacterium]
MNNLLNYLPWIIFGAGAWSTLNGLLHDIFVLASDHGKQYDRNLLRLLMDGHILITCGIVLMLCVSGLKSGNNMTYYIAIACCASLLIYCGMIWPFLKSAATTFISLVSLCLLIIGYILK